MDFGDVFLPTCHRAFCLTVVFQWMTLDLTNHQAHDHDALSMRS